MKIQNKLIKSTTVAEKADLWGNFIITILTRTGLHSSHHCANPAPLHIIKAVDKTKFPYPMNGRAVAGKIQFGTIYVPIHDVPTREGSFLFFRPLVNWNEASWIVGNADPSWRPHMKSLRTLYPILIKDMMTQELEKW